MELLLFPRSSKHGMLNPLCSIHLYVPFVIIKMDWIDHLEKLWSKTDISGMTPYFVKFFVLWDIHKTHINQTQKIVLLIRKCTWTGNTWIASVVECFKNK